MRLLTIALLVMLTANFTFVNNLHDDEVQRLKFLYIKNFIKNIEWPNNSNRKEFKIGILGDRHIYDKISMINIRPEHANGRNIAYYYFQDTEALLNCQLIYVSEKKSEYLPEVINHYRNQPVLIISEAEKACENGGMINFYRKSSDKISFEYNSESLKSAGLLFSANFMEQGKKVNSVQ